MAWHTSKWTPPAGWTRTRAAVLTDHHGICHLCGHAGADHVDHVIARSRGGSDDPVNLRPIHGHACPTCGIKCHAKKTGADSLAGRPTRQRRREQHPGML